MYIVFEGIVGSGKSTHAQKLREYLEQKGMNVVSTREPGGTEIAEAIRKLVIGTKFSEKMNIKTEIYLFAAARAQSLPAVVKPALDASAVVISDRSYSSTAFLMAQGIALEDVLEINKLAIGETKPDLIIYLDVDIHVAAKRLTDKEADKFEEYGIEFFKKVKSSYKTLSNHPEFSSKWKSIKVSEDEEVEEVQKRVREIVTEFFQLK